MPCRHGRRARCAARGRPAGARAVDGPMGTRSKTCTLCTSRSGVCQQGAARALAGGTHQPHTSRAGGPCLGEGLQDALNEGRASRALWTQVPGGHVEHVWYVGELAVGHAKPAGSSGPGVQRRPEGRNRWGQAGPAEAAKDCFAPVDRRLCAMPACPWPHPPAQQDGRQVAAQLRQQVVARRLALCGGGRQLPLQAVPLDAPALLQAAVGDASGQQQAEARPDL